MIQSLCLLARHPLLGYNVKFCALSDSTLCGAHFIIMAIEQITVRGARQHNLKNISVEIPRNRLTVITGLSGSGKSSLAFDTIYAEGQRRYVESLSAYARQFLDQLESRTLTQWTASRRPSPLNRRQSRAARVLLWER